MIAKAHPNFWKCYRDLSPAVQRQADKQFALWLRNPFHPSLHFKVVAEGVWSARVDARHRALARVRGELVVWFWIGSHDEYERLIAEL